MPQQNIAVIGGGPKAAALAAKAHCLRLLEIPINVTIFEKDEIGAAWSGRYGYTDGGQRLCTPAERDLGYPYDPDLGSRVAALMQAHFSWAAYKIAQPSTAGYADWVRRGRKPPTHVESADYLRHAVQKSQSDVFYGRVTALSVKDQSWTIDQIDRRTGRPTSARGFHGVVFTGPGPSKRRFKRISDPRVFTGQSFWSELRSVTRLLQKSSKRIAIIGGGGTAAAIAGWLVRTADVQHEISLLHNQATLFTRTLNFFEDRIFDDEITWRALSEDDRRSFALRLNRGVVWESVTDLLTDARRLTLIPGWVNSVTHGARRPGRGQPELLVSYSNSVARTNTLPADIVIDASGFDAWWFRKLLPPALRNQLGDQGRTAELERTMAADLSLALPDLPKLHAPMHSQMVGPGYMSLMVLGAMADRVLKPYVDAAKA